MKNQIIFLLTSILILAFNSINSQNKLISFTDNETALVHKEPTRTIESSETNVIIKYSIPNCLVSNKKVQGVDYQFLNIKNFDHINEVGFPSIPSHIDIVALPYESKTKITIESVEYIEYSNYYLHPILSLASDEIGAPEPSFEINKAQYEKNEFYPKNLVDIVDFQKFSGTSLAFAELHPVQFNPVTKKIRVY
ncbi:MAG: hypothetical protein CL824_02130, partial [Crocinitomicaceae bacterium]|nr:hypothetical protein [Crocinitomicaceae bacterium]